MSVSFGVPWWWCNVYEIPIFGKLGKLLAYKTWCMSVTNVMGTPLSENTVLNAVMTELVAIKGKVIRILQKRIIYYN